MNSSHIVSLVLALFAALLVIVAGRSCARSAERANKESRAKNTTTQQYKLITENPYTKSQQNIADPDIISSQGSIDDTTSQYETVTDMFGDVVETIPVAATKATVEADIDAPTTTLSILDEYNLSIGEDIYADDDDEVSTTEYIAPATNITIYVE